MEARGAPASSFDSPDPETTFEIAALLGRSIGARGLAIGLVGPLGSGKTVFVKGLAEGLGVDPRVVSSPTFVIAQQYAIPDGPGDAAPPRFLPPRVRGRARVDRIPRSAAGPGRSSRSSGSTGFRRSSGEARLRDRVPSDERRRGDERRRHGPATLSCDGPWGRGGPHPARLARALGAPRARAEARSPRRAAAGPHGRTRREARRRSRRVGAARTAGRRPPARARAAGLRGAGTGHARASCSASRRETRSATSRSCVRRRRSIRGRAAGLAGIARLLDGRKLDPNTAPRALLENLPGIGPGRAAAIVAERERSPFGSTGELERVPGIGPKTREKLEPFLEVDSGGPPG